MKKGIVPLLEQENYTALVRDYSEWSAGGIVSFSKC